MQLTKPEQCALFNRCRVISMGPMVRIWVQIPPPEDSQMDISSVPGLCRNESGHSQSTEPESSLPKRKG
jgi:hypothetical protein